MGNNAHDAYLESRILTAEPMELVRLLYQAATGAVRDARRCLEERILPGVPGRYPRPARSWRS